MKELDFKPVTKIFNKITVSVKNKLERENLMKNQDLQQVLNLFFNQALNNYYGAICLCEFYEKENSLLFINAPALNRSLFDTFFQTIFLLEFPERFRENFFKSRLRESKEIHNFRKKEIGVDNNEIDDINEKQKFIDNEWGLTNEQKRNYKKLPKHISTQQIANEFSDKKLAIAPFLTYLSELYYWNLSQFSHSQSTGIVRLHYLIIENDKQNIIDFINSERWTAINLFLCFLSEIEMKFGLGLKQDILTLWTYQQEGSFYTKKIFEMRYKSYFTS